MNSLCFWFNKSKFSLCKIFFILSLSLSLPHWKVMLVTDHPFHTLLFLFDQISSQADQFLKVSKYLGLCNKMDFAPKQRKSRQDDKHNKFKNSSVVVKIHNNQHCDHFWDCGKIVQKKNICSSHGISMIGVWGRVGPTLIALGGRSLNQWGLSAAGKNWTNMWSDQCIRSNWVSKWWKKKKQIGQVWESSWGFPWELSLLQSNSLSQSLLYWGPQEKGLIRRVCFFICHFLFATFYQAGLLSKPDLSTVLILPHVRDPRTIDGIHVWSNKI